MSKSRKDDFDTLNSGKGLTMKINLKRKVKKTIEVAKKIRKVESKKEVDGKAIYMNPGNSADADTVSIEHSANSVDPFLRKSPRLQYAYVKSVLKKRKSETNALVSNQHCETIPVTEKPIPNVVEPIPNVVEPTPNVVEPTPNVVEPTPNVVEPTPNVVEPTPNVVEPTPNVSKATAETRILAPHVGKATTYDKASLNFTKANSLDSERKVESPLSADSFPISLALLEASPSNKESFADQAKGHFTDSNNSSTPLLEDHPVFGRDNDDIIEKLNHHLTSAELSSTSSFQIQFLTDEFITPDFCHDEKASEIDGAIVIKTEQEWSNDYPSIIDLEPAKESPSSNLRDNLISETDLEFPIKTESGVENDESNPRPSANGAFGLGGSMEDSAVSNENDVEPEMPTLYLPSEINNSTWGYSTPPILVKESISTTHLRDTLETDSSYQAPVDLNQEEEAPLENLVPDVWLREDIPENLAKPFRMGFVRIVKIRNVSSRGKIMDVSYILPEPYRVRKRMNARSFVDIQFYLDIYNITGVSREDFIFRPISISRCPWEVFRQAKLTKRRRPKSK